MAAVGSPISAVPEITVQAKVSGRLSPVDADASRSTTKTVVTAGALTKIVGVLPVFGGVVKVIDPTAREYAALPRLSIDQSRAIPHLFKRVPP